MASNQIFSARYWYDPFGWEVSQSGSLASANVYRSRSKCIRLLDNISL